MPSPAGEPTVLYRDDDLLVIDKPSGWLTHFHPRDPHRPNCVRFLEQATSARVYPIHRIDRITSGLVVFALSRPAAAELGRQLREREVEKEYLALVRGHLEESRWIETPVRRTPRGDERVPARSHAEPLSRTVLAEPVGRYAEAWYTLVRVRLETGRLHQARTHLHHIDHPVIGDGRHGDRGQNRFFAARFGMTELMLRAYRLELHRPADGRVLRACSGIPTAWLAVFDEIGIDVPESLPRASGVS